MKLGDLLAKLLLFINNTMLPLSESQYITTSLDWLRMIQKKPQPSFLVLKLEQSHFPSLEAWKALYFNRPLVTRGSIPQVSLVVTGVGCDVVGNETTTRSILNTKSLIFVITTERRRELDHSHPITITKVRG